MFKLPTQPQLTSEILGNSIKLFFFCFPKVLPLILVDVVLSILLHLHLPQLVSFEATVIIASMMDSWLYIFLYMLVALLLHTAIFYRIGAIINQFDMGNLDALLQAIKKFKPIFLATAFYTFLVTIGFMVVVPGIIFMVSLRFFTPLILFEDATVIDSLQQRHKLVWKNWFRTAIVLAIPVFFSMSVAGMLSGVVEELFSTTLAKEGVLFLMQITSLSADRLLLPFFYTVILLLYYDLKRRTKQYSQDEKHFIA
jgi:hypothetical protein